MKAADGTKIAERWILIATGEGAASTVVSNLKEGLHTFSCCCGKTLDVCRDETVLYMLGEMNDPDNYSTDESGKPFQYRDDHECGSVTITRLDTWEELSASEERERKLLASLADADTVHANILRGTIALTKAQAIHIAGLPADIEGRERVLRDAVEDIATFGLSKRDREVARAALATPAPEQPAQPSAEKAGSK